MQADLITSSLITPEELVKARNYLSVLEASCSLYDFLKQAWPIIEGDTPFIDGWHIQAICEHLEACYKREIKNLLINIPPRCSKSSLVSVAFPAWCWLHNPSERFLYASYALSLALRDSVKCRRLILSPWYQSRWGDKFKIVGDQNTKGRFDNTKTGYRISTSVGSAVTGEGGSMLICFPYNTLISTDQGYIQIGQIVEEQIKCKILSYNHKTQELEYEEILKYEKNLGRALLEIEFDDGSILECTEDHPIFIKNKGYIAAKDIQNEDIVYSLI